MLRYLPGEHYCLSTHLPIQVLRYLPGELYCLSTHLPIQVLRYLAGEHYCLSTHLFIQVLRYLPGEHYTAHHDFFDPGEYGGERREQGHAHNRFATIFFYLNEVEA